MIDERGTARGKERTGERARRAGDELARTARRSAENVAGVVAGVNVTALATEKLLPQNVEAEACVLGSLLINPSALPEVRPFLRPEDFYRDAHRIIYQAICDLDDTGVVADFVTLTDALQRFDTLEAVGGASFVGSLANQVPTSANIVSYARIVERTATLRRLIHTAGQIAGVAYYEPDADAALDQAQQLIDDVRAAHRGAARQGPQSLGDSVSEWLTTFALLMAAEDSGLLSAEVAEAQAQAAPISTGLHGLDGWLKGGMRRGNLLTIGATPAQGKTSLALTIAANVAKAGGRVLIFSLEMTTAELLTRLIAQVSGVSQDVLQQPQRGVSDEQMAAIGEACGQLADWALYVDDTPALTISELAARARALTLRVGALDLLAVDYLQLVQGSGSAGGAAGQHSGQRRSDTREQEVTSVAHGLKALAKLLDTPVLALAQVNDKQVEGRADKRPLGSDYRESSAIYHDSDVALMLYRDAVYHPDDSEPGQTEVLFRKNRNGAQGICGLWFDAPRTRFLGLATDQPR